MRIKIERFLPLTLLSFLFLTPQALAATPIWQRFNDIVLGIFGLSSSQFATEAGQSAWIFVFCGFAIVFGIFNALSGYLPFFKDPANKGARTIFSAGMGIASIIFPGWLDALWSIGTIGVLIITFIVLVFLIVSAWRGGQAGIEAANADRRTEVARGDEAGLRSTQATQTGRTVTAQANTVVAQQTEEQTNLIPARSQAERDRLQSEQDARDTENDRLANEVAAELNQQRNNAQTQRLETLQNQREFRQTMNERLDQVRQQRRMNNQEFRQFQEQVTQEVDRLQRTGQVGRAETATTLAEQQRLQTEAQRNLNAEQNLLTEEQTGYNNIQQLINGAQTTANTSMVRLQTIQQTLRNAGRLTNEQLRERAFQQISSLTAHGRDLRTLLSTQGQVLTTLNTQLRRLNEFQDDNVIRTYIRNRATTTNVNIGTPRRNLQPAIDQIRALAQAQTNEVANARTQLQQALTETDTFSDNLGLLSQAINAGDTGQAEAVLARLMQDPALIRRRQTEMNDILLRATRMNQEAEALVTQLIETLRTP